MSDVDTFNCPYCIWSYHHQVSSTYGHASNFAIFLPTIVHETYIISHLDVPRLALKYLHLISLGEWKSARHKKYVKAYLVSGQDQNTYLVGLLKDKCLKK